MSLDGTTTGPTVRSVLKREIDFDESRVNQLVTEPDRSEETAFPISTDDPRPDVLALEMNVTEAVKSEAKYQKTSKEKYEEILTQLQIPTTSGSQIIRLDPTEDGSVSLPVNIGATHSEFIVDFAIGHTLITQQLCTKVFNGLCPDKGKLKTNAHGEIQKTAIENVSLSTVPLRNIEAGVVDLSSTTNAGIDGLLSLGHFLKTPLTLDLAKNAFILEDEESIVALRESSVSIPVDVIQDELGARAFVVVALPSGDLASLLIDTRADTLVLNEKYKASLEIAEGRIVGGDIALASEPRIREANPRVVFKSLTYDGALGLHFFKKHRATFDLQRSQLLLAQ